MQMRLRAINNIQQANCYLPEFIEEFNAKFSVEPKSPVDAHRVPGKRDDLDRILTIREQRVLSKNLTLSYKKGFK